MTPITPFVANQNRGDTFPTDVTVHRPDEAGDLMEDLRELATREASVLVVHEIDRHQEQWRGLLESFSEALDKLRERCEVAVTERRRDPSLGVAALVDKLVTASVTHADTETQRIREEAQDEIAELRRLIECLEQELETERGHLEAAREQLAEEQQAHARAAAAREEVESKFDALGAELNAERAESARLRQQLDVQQDERARLESALHAVQRALAFAEPGRPTPPTPTGRRGSADSDDASDDVDLDTSTAPAEASGTHDSDALARAEAPLARAEAAIGRHDRTLTEADAGVRSDPELAEYVKRLLADVEVMYWADLESARGPADVVTRLTANLRYARDVFSRRLESPDANEATLFERELMALLDATTETSFGRHLAFSAYELYPVANVSRTSVA